jgi:threonine synthase
LRREVLDQGGAFESVSDEDAYRALKTVAQLEGLSVEPATALAFAGLFQMVRRRAIRPEEVVVLNCSGHTFPVEKHILGSDLGRAVDVTPAARQNIPHEGLLTALEMVDTDISQVIVIEDDPGASTLMTRILRAYGVHDVVQAHDGRSGINLVRSMRPDLVVLDLMMPGVDGFDVLDELKEDQALRAVPVIVVTAKDLTLDERQRLSGQVESLLQKGSFMDDGVLEGLLEKLR